jgi:flagellar basal body-associated protein FliL
MKSNINILLIIHFYVFKLVIMLQIFLCCNKDVTQQGT